MIERARTRGEGLAAHAAHLCEVDAPAFRALGNPMGTRPHRARRGARQPRRDGEPSRLPSGAWNPMGKPRHQPRGPAPRAP
jgi:hypothetical protein